MARKNIFEEGRSVSCSVMPVRYMEDPPDGNSPGKHDVSRVIGRKNVIHVMNDDVPVPMTSAMQPILGHFKVLGLWKTKPLNWQLEVKKPWKNLSVRFWILLTTLFVLMIFKTATSLAYSLASGVKTIPTTVSDVFEVVVGFGTILHLLKNQSRMTRSFDVNWRMVRPFPRSRIVALKRKAIFLVILAWIYFSLLVGQAIVVVWITPPRMMKFYFAKSCENCPIWLGYVLRVSRGVGYSLLRLICALNIVLFIVLCLQTKATLRQLFAFYVDVANKEQINSSDVGELMSLWDDFSSSVKDVDQTYSAVVFLWYGDLLHRIVHYFPTGIGCFVAKNHFDGAFLVILAVFYAFLFASMTISASGIADCCEDVLHLVRRMSCKLQPQDPYVYQNMVILMTTLNYRNVYLTGWNCFVIRKYIILTVIGMVLTYMVLINQIISN